MVEKMWFGTEEYMDWIPAPNSGSGMSPEGWSAGGTLLGGGGYQANSWGSHKVYTFEWPNSSSPEMAQLMKSYSDGTYGRRLLYFVDPLTYPHNVLPARIADPSMALDDEGATLVYGLEPTGLSASGWQGLRLPVRRAEYNLNSVSPGFRGQQDATFVPIPRGYTLHLGAFYSASGSAGYFASPQTDSIISNPVKLTALNEMSPAVVANAFTGVDGVWIWGGKSAAGNATLVAHALIGRLVREGKPAPTAGPWVGGMGHSGCRPSGHPTWVAMNGVNGGQIAFSASFREVGSWSQV